MQTRRLRRRLAAAILPVVSLGVLALATPAPATYASTGRTTSGGAVTVPAPGAGDNATVSVGRTKGLVNQTIEVSWTGFRPSSASRLQNGGDSLDVNTENPVRVYECRGAHPASSSDCYGSPGFRGLDATDTSPAYPAVSPFTYPGQTNAFDATPDGPANWQDNVTRADGTGQVTIQVFTKRESAALGCDADSPCSIVVVPNYGRPQGDTEDLMDAALREGADVVGGRRRLPAVEELAARRGQPDRGRPAGDLARSHLHPVEERGDPRLHLDRRAADPR